MVFVLFAILFRRSQLPHSPLHIGCRTRMTQGKFGQKGDQIGFRLPVIDQVYRIALTSSQQGKAVAPIGIRHSIAVNKLLTIPSANDKSISERFPGDFERWSCWDLQLGT